ncbi:LPS assembly protein LptD [Vibrio ulleungensis]|uniref:LPS-assembly protein LptD n=1 Tax=Vibrio ulleungensis TaxID=2807619 RepID=A0ABS2HNA8_9VIBR|nr:LPS assembly protein LptD [Vibrio ulleungensis]MBM7037366.1 LPS assembly protein LptD [Vibrio ulleungensis]
MHNDSRTKVGTLLFAILCALPNFVAAESDTTKNTTTDGSHALGDNFDQCLVNSDENQDIESQTTYVEADSLAGQRGDKARYEGDVVVTQGVKVLKADTVTFHETDNIAVAEGNVFLTDGQIKTDATRVTTDLDTNNSSIENADYEMLCEQGRGTAKLIYSEGKNYYELEDGTITSCPEDDKSWQFKASSIEIDQDKQTATLHNPRFEIQEVPVFWMPYMTIPTGDERKTGFLYPSVAFGSRDGFEAEIPFYWNIAPNYDLETNIKYMQNRGLQLDNQFRLLTDFGQSQVDFQWLGEDKLYEDLGDRWGVGLQHNGIYNNNWKFGIDYGQVSDIYFFRDIDSNIGEREDGQLLQDAYTSYRNQNWDTTLRVRSFQLLYEPNAEDGLPYEMLPQLEANYYLPQVYKYLDLDVISHVTRFQTDGTTDVQPEGATRVHIEPGATIPIVTTWGSAITEARLLGTYYNQDIENYVGVDDLEEEVVRFVPQFRSIGTLILERDTSLFGGYTQTLEPTVQYLYVGKVDQSGIYGNYDTTTLQGDYYSLFRPRKKSGVDDIVAANQISYGASTRFYDDEYRERASLSFGQIIHLDDRYDTPNDDQLAWAMEGDFNFNDYLYYHGGLYYSVDQGELATANSSLEYRHGRGYIQGNYRYVTKDYIDSTVDFDTENITNDGISQLGLVTGYSINRNWQANVQYYYDTTESIPLELVASLRYNSDCWYIGFTYSDLIRSYENLGVDNSEPEYEQNLGINFGIVGFGQALGSDTGSNSGALGYGRPFRLDN